MFKTSTTDHDCDKEGDSLGAGLLLTAAPSRKYGRLWRRSLYIGIFITLPKKSSSDNDGVSPQSLSSYVAVPPPPADEPFSRTSSSRSQVIIVVHSDSDKEEDRESPGNHEEDEHELHRKSVALFVEKKDLDSLRNFGGLKRVASVLGSNLETGIHGCHPPNTANQAHVKGFFAFFLEACNSYTIFLLLISAGSSFSIGIVREGPKYGWYDGATILFVVFLLVTLPPTADCLRARKLEKEKKKKLRVSVVRGGTEKSVTISDILVGDIVCLKKDDRIPADGLFVHGDGIVLDEVLDSNIICDQNPFLFSGSKVIEGQGRMLITSVGKETKLGKVLGSVSHDPKEKTVLEAKIDKSIRHIDNVALGISILISLVLSLRLLGRKHDNDKGFPELKGEISVNFMVKIFQRILFRPRGVIGLLTTSLIAMVIGLQHGMPFVITVCLAYWNEKMVSYQASPQHLLACGTMGLVDVICADTAGGLMCKQMEVNKFWIGVKDVKDDENSETSQFVLETLSHGISVQVLVSEIPVNLTDDLLISWVESRWNMNMERLGEKFSILDHRKLCSNKKGCGVLMRKKNGDDEKVLHLHWKGAASTILGMCSHYYDCGGETCAMENQKSKFEKVIKDMEEGGLRPIAYAYKPTEIQELGEDGLNLLAIVGFKCPALDALRNAGVSIKLVSGDDLSAVRAISCELGLIRPGSTDVVLEGEEFRELNPNAMKEKVDEIIVMGSSFLEDKLLMVQCLKQKGHIVAFVGGLTTRNTLALKEADVGITEKTRSNEMTQESSDFVIADNGFSSLPLILMFGRCVYHNIQKFVQLQFTATISGLLLSFITTMSLGESPITGLQLIWVNLIMCLLGGLMMVMEPLSQEPRIGTQPAAKRSESLITKIMWTNIITQVLYQTLVLLIFQFKGPAIPGMNQKVMNGFIFNSFTLCQVFNQFNAMDLEKKEVFDVVLRKYYSYLVAVWAISVTQFLVVEFAGSLANCVRLNWVQWAFCFAIAALSWGFDRAVKSIPKSFISPVGLQLRFSGRMGSPIASLLVFPFSMFLLFSLSYYFNPVIARTFR